MDHYLFVVERQPKVIIIRMYKFQIWGKEDSREGFLNVTILFQAVITALKI